MMKSERAGGRGIAGRARKSSKDESIGEQERDGGEVHGGSPSALTLGPLGSGLPLGKGRIRSLFETGAQASGESGTASRRASLPDSGDLILPHEARHALPKNEFQIRTVLNTSREVDDGFQSE